MNLGFIMAFNEVNWIEFAIEQAMKICDRIIISEGSQFTSFTDIPERSNDGTLDMITKKQREYPQVITVIPSSRVSAEYRKNQCENFNRALRECNPGDYFIPLDVDEFYSDNFLNTINEITKVGHIDHLLGQGHLYGFSFKYRLVFGNNAVWKKDILFKVNNSFKFIPTHKPTGQGKNKLVNTSDSLFHYTWLKPTDRMRIRMQTSNFHPGMLEWFDTNWENIKLEENIKQKSHLGTMFTLKKYDGEHPSVLNNHPWRHTEDIRTT